MNLKPLLGAACAMICVACSNHKPTVPSFITENVEFAKAQLGLAIDTIEASGKCLNPVTLNRDGSVYYCGYADWRSGFFPGSIWYLYELTGDTSYLPLARKYTEAIRPAEHLTWHHDIGFIINCSFGNGLRLAPDTAAYKNVMIQAAKSLCTRFRPNAGVIQSWDVKGNSWQSERGWECPVIIDNMMNLELLFEATKLSGDSTFYKVAVAHADRTLSEHFRPDGSCYHVVDYNISDGSVRHKQTAQGYADESVWSRGQAWAIYGFTICYRETKDRKYLDQALKTFNRMKNDPHMPEDLIPYWDMDAPFHTAPNPRRRIGRSAGSPGPRRRRSGSSGRIWTGRPCTPASLRGWAPATAPPLRPRWSGSRTSSATSCLWSPWASTLKNCTSRASPPPCRRRCRSGCSAACRACAMP